MAEHGFSSFEICAAIGSYISSSAPRIEYTESDLEKAREKLGDEGLEELSRRGLYDGDFEKYYVLSKFCRGISLPFAAGGDFMAELFKNAKKLDADAFERDPYMRIPVKTAKNGDILLTHAYYEKGEIFQYDMPDISGGDAMLKLGFFTRRVRFPALYDGDVPWVSVCPSEINSMAPAIAAAHGKVLALGLGLGYYAHAVMMKDAVESVTAVELDGRIIDVFKENLLPYFENREKLSIVRADAVEYMKGVVRGEYDFVFADIWEGAVDGAPLYTKIKAHEERLRGTEFSYWMEKEIKAYLSDGRI